MNLRMKYQYKSKIDTIIGLLKNSIIYYCES